MDIPSKKKCEKFGWTTIFSNIALPKIRPKNSYLKILTVKQKILTIDFTCQISIKRRKNIVQIRLKIHTIEEHSHELNERTRRDT